MNSNFTLYIYNKINSTKNEDYFISLKDFFKKEKEFKLLLQNSTTIKLNPPQIKALKQKAHY